MLILIMLNFAAIAYAQSDVQELTLVLNGHSGKILVYRINQQAFVDVEALARIGQGSASVQRGELVVTVPGAVASVPAGIPAEGMTRNFKAAALKDLAMIKDWHATIAHALQRGVPGDGSRLVVFHNRAAEGLHLATVDASTDSDQQSLRLLTNHFNQVDRWNRRLVDARKSMSTGHYSMSTDALERDSDYQAIARCSQFLSSMLAGSKYEDNDSCH